MSTDLLVAALKLRDAVEEPVGADERIDPVHRRQLLRSVEEHCPALFEAIGDVLVAVTSPPTAEESRRLHPAGVHTDDVGHVHPSTYPDPEVPDAS